tara:strand:+ start:45 stop:395 length:351 start_codon:yes stop_codon:yes gene_type:complete
MVANDKGSSLVIRALSHHHTVWLTSQNARLGHRSVGRVMARQGEVTVFSTTTEILIIPLKVIKAVKYKIEKCNKKIRSFAEPKDYFAQSLLSHFSIFHLTKMTYQPAAGWTATQAR